MRRRKGIMGYIVTLILFIAFAGLTLAVLRQFDGDLMAAISWFIDFIVKAAARVADWFSEQATFRKVFS